MSLAGLKFPTNMSVFDAMTQVKMNLVSGDLSVPTETYDPELGEIQIVQRSLVRNTTPDQALSWLEGLQVKASQEKPGLRTADKRFHGPRDWYRMDSGLINHLGQDIDPGELDQVIEAHQSVELVSLGGRVEGGVFSFRSFFERKTKLVGDKKKFQDQTTVDWRVGDFGMGLEIAGREVRVSHIARDLSQSELIAFLSDFRVWEKGFLPQLAYERSSWLMMKAALRAVETGIWMSADRDDFEEIVRDGVKRQFFESAGSLGLYLASEENPKGLPLKDHALLRVERLDDESQEETRYRITYYNRNPLDSANRFVDLNEMLTDPDALKRMI